MSNGMNRVFLAGGLGADPELRFTQGGQAVLSLRMATSESYKDKTSGEWKEKTEWHNVTVWGARAEGLSKILQKGSQVFVEGSLHTSSFEGKDGQKRYKTEINASNIVLAGGKSAGGDKSSNGRAATKSDGLGTEDGGGYYGADQDLPF